MTAFIVMGASRQSTVLAVFAGLHVGAVVLFASGMMPRLLDALPAPAEIVVVQRMPEPVAHLRPGIPSPADYAPVRAPLPNVDIPRVNEMALPADSMAVPDGPATGGDSSGQHVDFQPPALQIRDKRLAALVDACYPSGARRMGEEGRAVALIVVSAEGRAVSWTRTAGSDFPRLDAALDCVVRRLQFQPGQRDGRAIVAEVRLPIVFQLH